MHKGKRATYIDHISLLLKDIAHELGWNPILDQGHIVGLHHNHKAITLEPGGQFELSGAPLKTLKEIDHELNDYFNLLAPYLKKYNLDLLFKGYDPHTSLDQISFMPKQRYSIMAPYMETKGHLGHHMMKNTCTVQVNLDFESEEDMVKKFRVAVALQSIVTALFANSSMKENTDTGYKSFRRHIWTDTDADRCGLPLFVFDKDMGFEKYAQFAFQVPMYFIVREGRYINMAGYSFEKFIKGQLPVDYEPLLQDWIDHLTTIFTEVRLKTYLEMRGADSGTYDYLMALPAFWMGLLYHAPTLNKVYDWIQTWSKEDIKDMAYVAAQKGHEGLKDICLQTLHYAHAGLECLDPLSTSYLSILFEKCRINA